MKFAVESGPYEAMDISRSLMPHAVCWAAAPRLIWTMVVTNLVTFLSYVTICVTLLYLARRTRKVIARDWAFVMSGFAFFIIACGSTHLLEVVTTWIPVFWIDAWANVITAVLSAYVAVIFILRARRISFGINDYAGRLANSESEKLEMQHNLVAAKKIEEWSQMSATVSHEIRGPIDAIQNLQYLIRNSAGVSPAIAELALAAGEEAQRVLAIANAALSFMRDARRQEDVDMRDALQSVRFLIDPLIREKQIDFKVEIHGECVVQAYSGETRQVLLNLVRNACEAVHHPGCRVVVSVNGDASGCEVLVRDEGAGIAPSMLGRLFEFGVTTKGEKGNGMGLWSVKHILNKHGGDIRVESTVGEGTCFRLWWPKLLVAHNEAVA